MYVICFAGIVASVGFGKGCLNAQLVKRPVRLAHVTPHIEAPVVPALLLDWLLSHFDKDVPHSPQAHHGGWSMWACIERTVACGHQRYMSTFLSISCPSAPHA